MKNENLIVELTNNLEQARKCAVLQKIDFKNVTFGNQVFANHVDEGLINPKYISFKHYQQIVYFYKFLKENENLTEEEIKNLLNTKFYKFLFLRKLSRTVPNFIEELKSNGPRTIAIEYVSNKIFSRKDTRVLS